MAGLLQDFRLALRTLLGRPAFTALATAILAIGIGANATVFGLVNAILIRPLPVEQPDGLVRFYETRPDGSSSGRLSYPAFTDLSENARSFSGLAAVSMTPVALGSDGESEQLLAEIASGDTFRVLGVRATIGRTLQPEDDAPGSPRVAIISDRLWRTRFAADTAALGSTLRLNGQTFTLTGVVDSAFRGTYAGAPVDLWIPIQQVPEWLGANRLHDRTRPSISVLGRLQPGTDIEQARSELQALSVRLAAANPEVPGLGFELGPATVLHGSMRRAATGFFGVLSLLVGLVLLLACANLAGLLLARAVARSREIAIRVALGASRWRILRQLLVESALLSALGAAAGLLLSTWLVSLLGAFNPVPTVPLEFDFTVDGRVTLFIFATALLCAVLLGLIPALQTARRDVLPALKGDAVQGRGLHRSTLRDVLLVGQVVLSLVLLASAGLFLRSLQNATSIDPGFDTKHGVAFDVDLELHGYSEPRGRRFYAELIERFSAIPGVRSAALTDLAPLDVATSRRGVNIEGHQPSAGLDAFSISTNRVSPGYFETLKIPLREGREFLETDSAEAQAVVIINETFASRFWPGLPPLDQVVSLAESGAPLDRRPSTGPEPAPDSIRGRTGGRIARVVGVARDVRYRTLGEDPAAHLYVPFAQDYSASMTVLLQTEADPAQHLAGVPSVLAAMDSSVQGFFARTLVDHASFTLLPSRLGAAALGLFGLIGLVLASLGLYGAVSLAVARRTREIGIRVALGAQAMQVLRLVVGRVVLLAAVGLGLGTAAALALTRLLGGLLHGVTPGDPVTYAGVILLLSVASIFASLGPARRAIRVDPLIAIRHE